MTRHASADQLALLAVGELGRRKAARVAAHLTGCAGCTRISQHLAAVSITLERVQYPPMAEHFSARIEVAIATESAQRLAAAPAAEAGRRDLPARRSAGSARWRGWRIPGLTVPATRVVTAAAAVAVIAGGGYAIATSVGGPSGAPAQTAGSAALPAPARQLSLGPTVTYGRPGAMHSIRSVRSPTNFAHDQLPGEVVAAVRAAELKGATEHTAPSATSPSAANHASVSAGTAGPGTAGTAGSAGTAARLAGCVNLIAQGRTVLLVDLAHYDGTPATIIVTQGSGTSRAEAWVVGDSCSATSSDVLAHISLAHL